METQALALLLGDDFPLIPLIVVVVIAIIGMIVLSILGKKKQ